MRFLSVLLILLCFVAAAPPASAQPSRLALVVGNSDYKIGPLQNPVNDAELVASTLGDLGFKVTRANNVNRRDFERAVVEFSRALRNAGSDAIGLFYYAGHGVQASGENYLIPVDAQVNDLLDLRIQAVDISTVMASLEAAGNQLNIVILDACRNNPFRSIQRSASRGLAKIDAPFGTLVAYSTAPGEVALDGKGRNSPYSLALSKAMKQPGLQIEQVFKRTRIEVMERTGRQQVPWESSSLVGDFSLNPLASTSQTASVDSSATSSTATQPDNDRVFWESIRNSDNPLMFQAYLDAYPNGSFAPLAQIKLAELQGGESVDVASLPEPAPSEEPAQTANEPTPAAGKTFRDCDTCPLMTPLPLGQFSMGSPNDELDRQGSESPVVKISVRDPIAVGVYEVTRRQFSEFVSSSGYEPDNRCYTFENGSRSLRSRRSWESPGFDQTDNDPVTCMSWEDATAYADWLAKKTGKPYRLLNEAEWEYAARAGTSTRYSFGNDSRYREICTYGNGADESARRRYRGWTVADCDDGYVTTAPVGSFEPNAFGLYDVYGNVWEWVEDCWNETHDGAPRTATARNDGDCSRRVLRGGAWDGLPHLLRSAMRSWDNRRDRDSKFGFRVARDLN